MSRIDQALSKTALTLHPGKVDTEAGNPWDIEGPTEVPATAPPSAGPAETGPAPADYPAEPTAAPTPGEPLIRRAGGSADVTADVMPPAMAERVVGGALPLTVVEEYRRLGALLHHMQMERDTKIVMITSAVAGEGKTLSAVNLALTLSGSYARRVLLIDADLRRPSLAQVFNTVAVTGLGDLLRDPTITPPLVQVTPRLTLLTAGRPDSDPMGGLTSDRMRHLLVEAKDAFDFVLIDTPPVALMTDANLLAAMVDVTFLVLRAESTPYELVKRATDAIGRHRIGGVILNRARDGHTDLHDYAGYYESTYPATRQA
ncbi:MAG TPA: polysaccharide biosynthesis tyrosine autokinase [Luteitalea sp.]|nr:polysaccharide biosynthesis tyrosine autokinase [Luteitalea sp.]